MIKSISRIIVIMIILLIFVSTEAVAGIPSPDLQPEEGFFGLSAFSYYYAAVSDRLLPDQQIFRKCQVVFLPSFEPESAVYISWDEKNESDRPRVVATELEHQLWAELQKVIHREPSKDGYYSFAPEVQQRILPQIRSNVKKAEAEIDVQTAKILEHLWETMLSRIRYPDIKVLGLDGENYHFANGVKGRGYRVGKVWSPEKGTPSYELIEIAKSLKDYPRLSEKGRVESSKSMSKRAERLLAQLRSK